MSIARLNGIDVYWREDGDPSGLPLIFANSLGTDLRLWDLVLPLLPTGLRVIRYDKRGHGLSATPASPYLMEELAQDAESLLDFLEIRECVFVGLSIGGMIAQSLARRRPDLIRALVLSNTGPKMGDPEMWHSRISAIEADGIEPLAEGILQRWFSEAFLTTEECTAWRQMLIRTPKEGYLGCCHAIAEADLCESTKTLRLPVLGIAGSEDLASPPDLVRFLVDLIPDAKFELLTGVGHLPCVETPERFAAVLGAYLQEVRHG